ncbi:hypothetical protein NL354_29535, partial [Klebsiella pneumoniae]|nr:hypothetical protein [Klebsiella pneumoniae]
VRAIMNQRLVRTLCQGCAHHARLGEVLRQDQVSQLALTGDEGVRTHNGAGCDLCNRTGISGRTLLLDAMMLTLGPSSRNGIY